MKTVLVSLSFVAAIAAVACAGTPDASSDPSNGGRSGDELTVWKNPDGTPTAPPPESGRGAEVGVGLPGLVCSSFVELAISAETLCRRNGLGLVALRPDGFCGVVGAADAGAPVPVSAGGSGSGSADKAPLPVPPVPGPGPVPGPIPPQWGFDHAIAICGSVWPPPPPPPPCGPDGRDCPPPPPCGTDGRLCPPPPPPPPPTPCGWPGPKCPVAADAGVPNPG